MVQIDHKPETTRRAVARGRVELRPTTLLAIVDGMVPKGDVLAVARVAGMQAVKRTADLIPLCHPLRITGISVDFAPVPAFSDERDALDFAVTVTAHDRTGVEMEALTGVSVIALTIYDMCKAIDPDMRISDIHLVEKVGGQPKAQKQPPKSTRPATKPVTKPAKTPAKRSKRDGT